MGLAKASPTMATVFTLSRSMVSRSSTGSKRRFVSVTTHPPTVMAAMAVNPPVPCMSGQAGRCSGPGPDDGLAHPVEATVLGHAEEVARHSSLAKRSSWRHMTPLGMPVVPPV